MLDRVRFILRELIRRRVLRTGGLYLVAVWGVSQGAAEIFPLFGASDAHVRWLIYGLLGLLPVVGVLSWMYDISGAGLERDPLDRHLARRHLPAETERTVSISISGMTADHVQVRVRDAEGPKTLVSSVDFSIGARAHGPRSFR